MESKVLLMSFAECFRRKRKEFKKTQIAFYEYLYPEKKKEPENIKKYISNIENAKIKNLDAELVIRFCKKCDVSADYLLGISTDYSNHETELVCKYTGLNENVVQQLHEWNEDKNNGSDLSQIDNAFTQDEEEEHEKMLRKQAGTSFLRIINYLFETKPRKISKRKKAEDPFYNVTILHSLYMLCMARPREVLAHWTVTDDLEELFKHEPYAKTCFEGLNVDISKGLVLIDNNSVWHPIDLKCLMEEYGKRHLMEELDQLIYQIRNEDFADT